MALNLLIRSVGMLLIVSRFATMTACAAPATSVTDPRQTALRDWVLPDAISGAPFPLTREGRVEPVADAAAKDPAQRVANFDGGYLGAGNGQIVAGEAMTLFLRARDPSGKWGLALFAKRGSHDLTTFNLFSVDLGQGVVIGVEVHTDRGFFQATFPISSFDAKTWHNLAARYDGKHLDLVCDGKIMARSPARGQLTQNSEPTLIGAETESGHVTRIFSGLMKEAALWGRALSDDELAALMHVIQLDTSVLPAAPYRSPVQFRPQVGALADTIPFFWKGSYHVFYLLGGLGGTPWEHIVSPHLVHWAELPTALPLGKPDEPDGGNVFTGSVIQRNGTFHIFYTGFNPGHPGGREQIMHATSDDLVHWIKHPEQTFRADGQTFQFNKGEDFRDPMIVWNESERKYWMLVCARDGKTGKPVTGLLKSDDLSSWQPVGPLAEGTDGPAECPDLFAIGSSWYLISSPSAGTTTVRRATAMAGPWDIKTSEPIDTPILYAAKRMYDGKRHVLVGWLRDLSDSADKGGFRWGGTQCVAREAYADSEGALCFKPVEEAVAVFDHSVLQVTRQELIAGQREFFSARPNFYLHARVRTSGSELQLGFRQKEQAGEGYLLLLRPQAQQVELSSRAFSYARGCRLSKDDWIDVQAFVQGSTIECFIDNAHAFSCRAYDFLSGGVSIESIGGSGAVDNLSMAVPDSETK